MTMPGCTSGTFSTVHIVSEILRLWPPVVYNVFKDNNGSFFILIADDMCVSINIVMVAVISGWLILGRAFC